MSQIEPPYKTSKAPLFSQLVQHIASELTSEPETINRDGLHDNQLYVLDHLTQYNVLVAGRRWGKSHLAMQFIREQASQGKRIWYCALTYGNVESFWRKLSNIYRGQDVRKSTRDIYTSEGGYIGVRSLNNYDNLRGEGLDWIVIDECAFVNPTAWYEVLQPMLLDNDGGLLAMSSPKGKNWFYDLSRLGYDDTMHNWRSFHYTTYDNPLLKKSSVDALKRRMTSRVFQEEIMAEFNDSDGAVFRNVRTCATATAQPEPIEGHTYIFGCDFARDNDYTVISIMDVNTGELVKLDRFNQVDYVTQSNRIIALYRKWQPLQVIAESNSIGAPMIDALRREGIPIRPFATTAKSKPLIIDALALAFETEAIKIINDPILIHELVSYEQQKTASGNMKFSAPEGGHDDCVMSLAIAWHGTNRRIGDSIPVIEF